MKILLTGGTSNLGTGLVLQLLLAGVHLAVVVRDTFRSKEEQFADFPNMQNLELISWDAMCSEFQNHRAIKRHPVFNDLDFVIHAATDYGHFTDSEGVFKVNVEFPMRLLSLVADRTNATFINIDTYYSLFARYEHLAAYGLTKRFFSQWGLMKNTTDWPSKKRFYNLRLFHIFGRVYQPRRFIPEVIRDCILGRDIHLTAGVQMRDFIFIDDAISLIIRIINELENGALDIPETVDLGSAEATTVRRAAELIHQITESKGKLMFGLLPTRDNEPLEVIATPFCIHKLKHHFIPFEEAIKISVSSITAQLINTNQTGIMSL